MLLEALERVCDLLMRVRRAPVASARMYATQASVVIVKPGGHPVGTQDARHLGDVRALAAEQVAHVARALGEVVDPLRLLMLGIARLSIHGGVGHAPIIVCGA